MFRARLAHYELFGLENTERLPERAAAHVEFAVKIQLARKQPTGPKFAGPYALQYGIANLQVKRSDLKFRMFSRSKLPPPPAPLLRGLSCFGCSSTRTHSRPVRSGRPTT